MGDGTGVRREVLELAAEAWAQVDPGAAFDWDYFYSMLE